MDEMKVVTVEVNSIEKSFFNEEEKANYVYDYVAKIYANAPEASDDFENEVAKRISSYLVNLPRPQTITTIQKIIQTVYREYDKTIKFNDVVLESLIGDNILNYKEENFALFEAETSKEDFLDVVSEYEQDAYNEDLEDEKIVLDEE